MFKQFTYSEGRPMKWLSILFLSLSCFAFSLSSGHPDARQILPVHIEQVVSAKGNNDKSPLSYKKFVSAHYSYQSGNRSREHEKNILHGYQREIEVHFGSITEKFHSFRITEHFLPAKIISADSDKGSNPLLLA